MGTSTLHLNNPVPSNGAVAASLGGKHTVTATLSGVGAISCKVQAWASVDGTDSRMIGAPVVISGTTTVSQTLTFNALDVTQFWLAVVEITPASTFTATVENSGDVQLGGAVLTTLGCVYDDESAAAANTAILQAALNRRRMVVTVPGVIYINNTLVVDSDTYIEIGDGVTLRLVAGTNKNVIRTKAYLRMVDTPNVCIVESKSGEYQRAYITGAVAHGLSIGDCVWLNCAVADVNWSGIQRVEAVTNATDFVVTIKVPTLGAKSFTAAWVAATQRVTFNCAGTLDYNYQAPAPSVATDGYGFFWLGTADGIGRVPAVENAYNFAYYFCASANNTISNPRSKYTLKDGVKVYGPSTNDKYENINCNANDDLFSCQAREQMPIYQPFQPYYGNIYALKVDGIYGISRNASVCAVYGADDAYMDQIDISNVWGYSAQPAVGAIRVASTTPTKYQIGSVAIKNFNCDRSFSCVITSIRARSITLDAGLDYYAGYTAFVETGSNVIDQLIYRRIKVKLSQGDIAYAIQVSADVGGASTLGRVEVDECIIEGTTGLLQVNASAVIKGCVTVSRTHNAGANIPIRIKSSCILSVEDWSNAVAGSSIVATESACNIAMRKVNGIIASLVRLEGAGAYAVGLETDGTVTPTLSTGLVTHTNASATVGKLNTTIAIPLNAAWLSRTANSRAVASAGVGTIVAGNSVICDATGASGSWKQISDTTKNY